MNAQAVIFHLARLLLLPLPRCRLDGHACPGADAPPAQRDTTTACHTVTDASTTAYTNISPAALALSGCTDMLALGLTFLVLLHLPFQAVPPCLPWTQRSHSSALRKAPLQLLMLLLFLIPLLFLPLSSPAGCTDVLALGLTYLYQHGETLPLLLMLVLMQISVICENLTLLLLPYQAASTCLPWT